MRFLILLFYFISLSVFAGESNKSSHDHHDHSSHDHKGDQTFVDGQKLNVDQKKLDTFLKSLDEGQVAVVSVKGMVCDFCARGISKTFKKDENVKKISIDLKNGKVVIAYQNDYKISFDDIKEKMLENGINAVKMEIINI